MSSEAVEAHQAVPETLRRAVNSGRMAHGFIFFGPSGIGKRRLAFHVARMLLCPNGGCGACPACQRVDTENHSDFRFIRREEGDKELKIEKIRAFQEEIHLQPMEGPNKVFIIHECHLMSEEAANSVLKTLEEPPGNSYLFLLTDTPDSLPETIRSRCQEVRVPPRTIDEIAGVVSRDYSLDADRARFLARLAEGSLGRARELHENHVLDRSQWILEKLRTLDSSTELGFAEELDGRLKKASHSLEGRREEFSRYVDLLNTFWRDMLYASLGIPEDRFFHRDAESLAFYREQVLTPGRAMSAIELSFTAGDWMRRNVNVTLAVENYVTELSRILSLARSSRSA